MKNKAIELAKKLDDLGLWEKLLHYQWAVKPFGTVIPYFCSIVKGDKPLVKYRLLMLEGWKTLHDFVRARADPDFGFYSSPMEFPHYEVVFDANGLRPMFRHDVGYMPCEITPKQAKIVECLLWQTYGLMLRVEEDPSVPMKFVEEQAVFARVETKRGKWEDQPLTIPQPPPHVEQISFDKNDLKKAKDLPMDTEDILNVNFKLNPNLMTSEPKPRCVYELTVMDNKTNQVEIALRVSISPGSGLKELWEEMPSQLLKAIIQRGRFPAEIKVCSGKVFRMLRPLCLELPFKLSLHDKLAGM